VSLSDWEDASWQRRHSLRKAADWEGVLELVESERIALAAAERGAVNSMLTTPYYASLIDERDGADDPIRRQCVPDAAELVETEHDIEDSLAEDRDTVAPGRTPSSVAACLISQASFMSSPSVISSLTHSCIFRIHSPLLL
jgi:lysine 2,3-aminomutase